MGEDRHRINWRRAILPKRKALDSQQAPEGAGNIRRSQKIEVRRHTIRIADKRDRDPGTIAEDLPEGRARKECIIRWARSLGGKRGTHRRSCNAGAPQRDAYRHSTADKTSC